MQRFFVSPAFAFVLSFAAPGNKLARCSDPPQPAPPLLSLLFITSFAPPCSCGKDAVDWHYRARQQYGDNALLDAFNSETMCTSLLQPAGEGWHYRNEDDMSSLIRQIRSTAERDLPFKLRLDDVATKPRIFNASSELFIEGYFPRVSYATQLPFLDSLALAQECNSVNAHIGEVFEGVDHYNKHIVCHVYPRVPADENDTAIAYHSMVRKSAASWFY